MKKMMIVTVGMVVSGCSVFMPAHTKSEMSENETVVLIATPISVDQKTKTKDVYVEMCVPIKVLQKSEELQKATHIESELITQLESVAAKAAISAGAEIAKEKMSIETDKYTAQYTAQLVIGDFWKINEWDKKLIPTGEKCKLISPNSKNVDKVDNVESGVKILKRFNIAPNYEGFKIVRCSVLPNSLTDEVCPSGDGLKVASELEYSFEYHQEEQYSSDSAIKIVPSRFISKYSKAKVLSDEWFTWIPPIPLLTTRIAEPNGSVDIKSSIEIENGKNTKSNLPIVTISNYRLDNSKEIQKKSFSMSEGYFTAPEYYANKQDVVFENNTGNKIVEYDDGQYNLRQGNITIKATITESDHSQATKIIDAEKKVVDAIVKNFP